VTQSSWAIRALAPLRTPALEAALVPKLAKRFSAAGYCTQTAGVTGVLVNRYFGSKEELFAATVELAFANTSFMEGDFTQFADRLTDAIMTKKTGTPARPYDGFLLLLRSAPNPRAAEIMRDCIAHRIEGPMKPLLLGPRAGGRRAHQTVPKSTRVQKLSDFAAVERGVVCKLAAK
jgi:AcrR family transcriptional regulator